MTRIRVVVTAEDIARGERQSSAACPVARAVRRRGFEEAAIGSLGYWYPRGYGTGPDCDLSPAAAQFIHRYDEGDPVTPSVFYLEGPDR